MKTNRLKANRLKNSGRRAGILAVLRNISAFILIFAMAIAVYICWGAIRSILPVKHIVFIGNRHLTDDELKALSGVHMNESLITLSNKAVTQRLLQSPWIRSVNARKEFPDTVSLAIEEAVPFALLDMNNHLFLVDDRGKLLEELKDNSIPFLPVISGDPFREKEGFSEAINLARLMNSKGFSLERDHIEIFARKPHELTITVDGTVVKMGAGNYEEKLGRLVELEEEIKNRGIPVDYIDLRFENKAVVKPITSRVIE